MTSVAGITLRTRWRHQRGLWAPRNPAFWGLVGLVILAGLLVALQQFTYLTTAPGVWLLSCLLLFAFVLPAILVVRGLDLYEREPTSLMLATFLWGSTAAIEFSARSNVMWGEVIVRLAGPEFAADWSAALTAPLIEEFYKVVGVVLVYLIARTEIDDLMDGFVYGAMVGLGFTAVEDVSYFMNHFGGSIEGVLEGFWVRVIASGLYGHVLYSGLAGIGIAYFVVHRVDRGLPNRVGVATALLLVAMLAHAFWNSPWLWNELPLLVATTVKGMPLFLALVVAVRLAQRREHRWLGATLHHEVDGPGITARELRVLMDPGRRRKLCNAVESESGRTARRTLQRLHREQINLAMISARVDDPSHPDLVEQRALISSIRATLSGVLAPGSKSGA